ncbi:hypothetical protein ACO0QE_002183 [Hanseniaspora vineae]
MAGKKNSANKNNYNANNEANMQIANGQLLHSAIANLGSAEEAAEKAAEVVAEVVAEGVAESLPIKLATKKTSAQAKKKNSQTTGKLVATATTTTGASLAAKNLYHRREAVCDRCRKWKRACYGVNAACNNCLMANHACTVSTPMIRKCKPKPVKILGLPITQSTNIPNKADNKELVSTSIMPSSVNTEAIPASEPAGSLRKDSLSKLTINTSLEEHPQYQKLLAENTALLSNEKKLTIEKTQAAKNLAQANQTITNLLEQLAVQTKKLEEANNSLLLTLQRQTQENLSAASEHLTSVQTQHIKTAKMNNKNESTSSSTVVGTPDNQNQADSTSLDALFSTKAQPSTMFRGESFVNLSDAKDMINLREEEFIGDLGFPSKMSTIKNSIFLNDMDKDFLKTLGVDM